jgi:methyltransferase (TIGR00027 family)
MKRLPPPSPALVTTHLLRTRHIDLALQNALSDATRQVVILGAGYDSRAYRFRDKLANIPVFEVDRPATQEYKKLRVKEALGDDLYQSVHWVAVNFEDDDLLTKLRSSGYSEGLRTFFVWEGATYYLPESGVRNILHFVRVHSAPGSTIAFDYMDENNPGINNPADFHARVGEPLLFGFPKGSTGALVRSEGLEVISDLSYDQLYDRYARRRDGSPAMPHSGGPSTLAGICIARVPVAAK